MSIGSATQLGAALREHRRRAGLTQAVLAVRAGISTRTVIEIERGHPTGEIGKVLALLRALDLTIDLAVRRPEHDATDLLDLAGHDL